MSDIHYKIVEHDGGWAYKVGDVFFRDLPDARPGSGRRARCLVAAGTGR